jgi:GMP synthase (glutamine-hydrolysing)
MQILIIDLGSQYALVIGRTLRELGYRAAVLSPKRAEEWLGQNTPKCIILSGGDKSVYEEGAPKIPEKVFTLKVPVLGICYGMQYMAHVLGGTVENIEGQREYGPIDVLHENGSLFQNVSSPTRVWASHGDSVTKLPAGFTKTATSTTGVIEAMENVSEKMYAVQFHPEVHDSVEGSKMLENFIRIVSLEKDWDANEMIAEIQEEVKTVAGDKKAIIGMSGGVDSTTLGAIISSVFGENLLALAIDHGGLREGEVEEIKANAASAKLNLKILDAKDRFFAALLNLTDAEEKRTKFKEVYQKVFEEEAATFGAQFVVQGSLATDFIESGKAGESALIKSHHNIGIEWAMQDLHPLRNLFKYEVRELAAAVGLPESVTKRHPFPGPGLFIRVVGTPVTPETIATVRAADAIVREVVKKYKLDTDIAQLIVALVGVKTVGVKGDARSYGHSIVVRAVETSDFMTARGYYFPKEAAEEITNRVTKAREVVRVWFDMTPKPPATTELE